MEKYEKHKQKIYHEQRWKTTKCVKLIDIRHVHSFSAHAQDGRARCNEKLCIQRCAQFFVSCQGGATKNVTSESPGSHWTPWRRNRLTAISAGNLLLGLDLVSNFQAFELGILLVVVGQLPRHGRGQWLEPCTVRLLAGTGAGEVLMPQLRNSQVESQRRFMSRAQMTAR